MSDAKFYYTFSFFVLSRNWKHYFAPKWNRNVTCTWQCSKGVTCNITGKASPDNKSAFRAVPMPHPDSTKDPSCSDVPSLQRSPFSSIVVATCRKFAGSSWCRHRRDARISCPTRSLYSISILAHRQTWGLLRDAEDIAVVAAVVVVLAAVVVAAVVAEATPKAEEDQSFEPIVFLILDSLFQWKPVSVSDWRVRTWVQVFVFPARIGSAFLVAKCLQFFSERLFCRPEFFPDR